MLIVDYFSIKWNSLALLSSYIPDSKNMPKLEIIKEAITLKANNQDIALYNPFLLKGPTASGKSLLLEGIAKELHNQQAHLKIALGQASGLISLYNDPEKSARRIVELQETDVLLLDDIHLLALYPHIQEDLSTLLDHLVKRNCLCVITYSNSSMTNQLEKSLLSRLSLGITLNFSPPDLDARMRFVEKLCMEYDLKLTRSMYLSVARFTQDIRHLHGTIKTLVAYVKTTKEKIDEETLNRILKGYGDDNNCSPELIVLHTAEFYALHVKDIRGKGRTAKVVLARHISMYLCRKLMGLSYVAIAEFFGGKDHTTVIHACNKIENQRELQATINILSQKILQSSSSITGF